MGEPFGVLVLGSDGQVGRELKRASWPALARPVFTTRETLDVAQLEQVRAALDGTSAAVVLNAAAYTRVDDAEGEAAAAFGANAWGPAILAQATAERKIPLVHISSDYVFDGRKPSPYVETDPAEPINVYGASKRAGELAVLSANPRSVVLRTSWILGRDGRTFVTTMRALARERRHLTVVDDQTGTPTSASDLAAVAIAVSCRLAADPTAPVGLYHFANTGSATWADLAREIFRLSRHLDCEVTGITTEAYGARARRPANSRLDASRIFRDYDVAPRDWRTALAYLIETLDDLETT